MPPLNQPLPPLVSTLMSAGAQLAFTFFTGAPVQAVLAAGSPLHAGGQGVSGARAEVPTVWMCLLTALLLRAIAAPDPVAVDARQRPAAPIG